MAPPDNAAGDRPQPRIPGFPAVVPARNYRRAPQSPPDHDGYVWVDPSASKWPNVKGNPPGPRTQTVGYNITERRIRCVFRDGTKWQYSEVTPQVWERVRRTASTGKFINRVLNKLPYGADHW